MDITVMTLDVMANLFHMQNPKISSEVKLTISPPFNKVVLKISQLRMGMWPLANRIKKARSMNLRVNMEKWGQNSQSWAMRQSARFLDPRKTLI